MLLDPGDEVRVSVGLLERHDPAGGLVVVHPTPGLSGLAAIAHDVLAALGRSIRRLKAERLVGSAQAGRAVVAWLLADQIEDLVVLRADRLSAAGWDWLLAVCRRTGTRLLLICHVQAVPPALADVLEGTTHEILTDLRRALPGRLGRSSRPSAPFNAATAKICSLSKPAAHYLDDSSTCSTGAAPPGRCATCLPHSSASTTTPSPTPTHRAKNGHAKVYPNR